MTDRRRLEVVEYKDWESGGTFSRGLLANQGALTDYQGMNFQVYRNGLLGPRPWLRRMLSPTPPLNATMAGLTAGGLYTYRDSFDGYQILISNNGATVYRSNWPGGTVWSSTALIHGGGGGSSVGGMSAYYSTGGTGFAPQVSTTLAFLGALNTWNPNTGATGTVTWPGGASPSAVVLWKGRAFGFRTTVNSNRVWYSDAFAPTTFSSASQFFDVGTSALIGAVPLRDALMFVSADGTWWTLTGGSPTTWTLRELGVGRVPVGAAAMAVYENAVMFWSRYAAGICVVTPDRIDSLSLDFIRPTIDKSVGFQTFGTSVPIVSMKPVPFYESSAVIFPFIGQQSDRGSRFDAPYLGFQSVDLINKVPSWSRYWVADTSASPGYGMDDATNTAGARIVGCAELANTLLVGVDEQRLPNNTTNTVALYTRDLTLDRPSKSTDAYSSSIEELAGVYAQDGNATQMSACELHLREYAPPPGNRVRVRRVLADVRYWDGDYYQDPAISLQVLNESGVLETIAHTSASHNLTVSSTGDTGMPGRVEWWPSPQPASMYSQIRFISAVSIAISKIIVEYEVFPE